MLQNASITFNYSFRCITIGSERQVTHYICVSFPEIPIQTPPTNERRCRRRGRPLLSVRSSVDCEKWASKVYDRALTQSFDWFCPNFEAQVNYDRERKTFGATQKVLFNCQFRVNTVLWIFSCFCTNREFWKRRSRKSRALRADYQLRSSRFKVGQQLSELFI